MIEFGHYSLCLAWLLSVVGMIVGAIAGRKSNSNYSWVESTRRVTILVCLGTLLFLFLPWELPSYATIILCNMYGNFPIVICRGFLKSQQSGEEWMARCCYGVSFSPSHVPLQLFE